MSSFFDVLRDRGLTAHLRELRLMHQQPAYRYLLNWLLVAARVVGPFIAMVLIANT